MVITDRILSLTYYPLQQFWNSKSASKLQGTVLLIAFLASSFFALFNHYELCKFLIPFNKIHFLQSVEVTFTILLLFEMISLVFVIPESIANSIGKQIEILSLVLLRSSFKEFANLDLENSLLDQLPSLYKMIAYGSGSLLIFFLVSFYYKIQKHKSITNDGAEKQKFVALKQIIAMLVLISLLVLQCADVYHLFSEGKWLHSVDKFYLILIFADLLFLFAAFKYTIHYPDIFRYSAFVLVTVFIRISLLSTAYLGTAIGILAALFAITITFFYNLFIQDRLNYINNHQLNKLTNV